MASKNKALQEAIDKLSIVDVYLHRSQAQVAESYDPKLDENSDQLMMQQLHVVQKSEILETDNDSFLIRIFVRLGVRWLNQQADQEDSIRAMIEADFIAEYFASEKVEQKCIDEFALKNASYHVWPYWREYLSSQSERMRLPRLVLPAVQFNQQKSKKG